MLAFVALLVGVMIYCLVPGMQAAKNATDAEKLHLMAWFRLLLAVLLVILFSGLLLTFRVSRFFQPRPTPPRTKTHYTDAWEESARRMPTPPSDDELEQEK